jgi:hypothetical protein
MEGLFLTHGFLNNDFVIFTATKNVCRFAVNFHKQSTQTIFSDTSKSRMFTKRFGKPHFVTKNLEIFNKNAGRPDYRKSKSSKNMICFLM